MLLLMASAHPTHMRCRHPNLGRLVVPGDHYRVAETGAAGVPWAADNGAFAGFNETAWRSMLHAVAGVHGCLFCVAPDVVGDAQATQEMWSVYRVDIANAGLPAAWVAQDGANADSIPDDAAAVFIGGTNEFKFSIAAIEIVRAAKESGRWVHVGRVNSFRRLRLCQSIGADSVDGSRWNRFRDTHLPAGLALLAGGKQLGMEV